VLVQNRIVFMESASDITDRAKRYRANHDVPEGARVCLFCGSTKDLGVDHIDGFEEHGEPENLIWLCRSCNQLKSSVYVKAGLGRRTAQFNMGRLFWGGPSETLNNPWGRLDPREIHRRIVKEKGEADARRRGVKRVGSESEKTYREVSRLVGQGVSLREALASVGNPARPVASYKGFVVLKGNPAPSETVYSSTLDPDSWFESIPGVKRLIDYFKNPATGRGMWASAVGVLQGKLKGSPFQAARVVRSTPVHRRYRYLDQMMRANPSVPTYGQYAFAVAQHVRGAHDEGGAVIHATPKAKRREYAGRIADVKRERGTAGRDEVPF
jgi:hypothetical protein